MKAASALLTTSAVKVNAPGALNRSPRSRRLLCTIPPNVRLWLPWTQVTSSCQLKLLRLNGPTAPPDTVKYPVTPMDWMNGTSGCQMPFTPKLAGFGEFEAAVLATGTPE